MAGSVRSIRQGGNLVEVLRDVGHMCCSSAASLRQAIMERRRSVREPDYVVSIEFLPRGGGETTILVISNRRVMCVRAHLPGYGIGKDGGNLGGGEGSGGVNGVGGQGSSGGRGGGGCLEWQVVLDAPTVLLALLEEDGARTILHFARVAGPVPPTSSSRRREVISGLRNKGGTAGLVAILGGSDGAGATAPSNSTTVGGPESNVMGITSGGVGSSIGRRSGGKVLRTRGVESLFRDPPALIRAFNIIACLTDRLNRVLLLPSGVNFSGSKIMSPSHFPTVGVERDPQIAIGGRHRVRSGFLGVVSIKEWEFSEDSRERVSLLGQWATRYTLDTSGTGLMHGSAFPGLGSPREVEEVGERRARRLSSEQPIPARRSESFAVRGDIPASTDLWVPLWLLMRQRNLALSEKMRPVPHTFEMDAVVWKPGPFPPETDPGSGWLLAPRSSALRAPNDLVKGTYRVAMDSELMLDDSPKALEVMGVLRRSEKFRMETVRPNVPETAKSALITPCMTVSATSSTLTIVDAWGGKDAAAVGGRGTDSGRDPETGATQGQIRPQISTFTVLGKLGGRLVPGREADEVGSGVLGSPSQDGFGGRSRRKSPGFVESPRIYDGGSVEGGSDRLVRRPWSAPRNAGRGVRRLVSVPCSSERPGSSSAETPLRGAANEGTGRTQQRTESVGGTERGGTGAGRRFAVDSSVAPLFASEIGNMSLVSSTSTVLSDLSIRPEKIEGMVMRSRLLDAKTLSRPFGGAAEDATQESARAPVFVSLAAAHGLPTRTGWSKEGEFSKARSWGYNIPDASTSELQGGGGVDDFEARSQGRMKREDDGLDGRGQEEVDCEGDVDGSESVQAPYVVENVDPTHWVYLRHEGAKWCLWQSVGLGESKGYVWEEPLLPPRLRVRVDPDNLRGGEVQCGFRGTPPSVAVVRLQAWGMERVCSEEAGTLLGQIKLIRYITALPRRDEDSVRRGIARASALKALERHSDEASSQNDVNRDLSADGDDQRSNSAGSTNGVLQNDWGPHADADLVPSREDNRRQESQSLLVKESNSGETVAKGASALGTSEKHVTAGGKEQQAVSMTYIQELENALGPKKVLAATGIRATDLSGTSDPHCVYYLKIPDYADVDKDARLRGSERRCTWSRRCCTPSNTSSSRFTRASTLPSKRRSFSR